MTAIPLVRSLLEQHGPSTVDALLPLCHGYTRKQVQAALWNGSHRKVVHLCGRIGRTGIYAAGPAPEPQPEPARVNSVFGLASCTPCSE